MGKELPENWLALPFTDIFDINGGTQPPKSQFIHEPKDGYIRLLQIRDFGKKPVPTYIPYKKTLKTCQIDDILIARYGASIGRIVTGQEGAYNVALAKVDIPDLMNKNFVKWVLNSSLFQDKITSFQRTAQSGFNKKDLAGIIIPLPPLPEQQRIVAKLDTLFEHIENTKTRLEKVPTLLKNFRQAVLTQAVTGKLTEEWREGKELESVEKFFKEISKRRSGHKSKKVRENKLNLRKDLILYSLPKSWLWSNLNFLLDDNYAFRYGVVQPGDYLDDQQKIIRVKDLSNDKVLFDQLRGISFEIDSKYLSARVKTGDLLVSIVGTIGRSAIVPEECDGYNIARALAKVPISDFSANYVKLFIDSEIGQKWLVGDTREVARKTLNLEQLKTLPVPVPTIKEQTEIVRRVESLFAKADVIEAKYKLLKEKIDNLPQTILSKAFKGELVEQLESDGDARELLEEIKKLKLETTKKK